MSLPDSHSTSKAAQSSSPELAIGRQQSTTGDGNETPILQDRLSHLSFCVGIGQATGQTLPGSYGVAIGRQQSTTGDGNGSTILGGPLVAGQMLHGSYGGNPGTSVQRSSDGFMNWIGIRSEFMAKRDAFQRYQILWNEFVKDGKNRRRYDGNNLVLEGVLLDLISMQGFYTNVYEQWLKICFNTYPIKSDFILCSHLKRALIMLAQIVDPVNKNIRPDGLPGFYSCLYRAGTGSRISLVGNKFPVLSSYPLHIKECLEFSRILRNCFAHALLFQKSTQFNTQLTTAGLVDRNFDGSGYQLKTPITSKHNNYRLLLVNTNSAEYPDFFIDTDLPELHYWLWMFLSAFFGEDNSKAVKNCHGDDIRMD